MNYREELMKQAKKMWIECPHCKGTGQMKSFTKLLFFSGTEPCTMCKEEGKIYQDAISVDVAVRLFEEATAEMEKKHHEQVNVVKTTWDKACKSQSQAERVVFQQKLKLYLESLEKLPSISKNTVKKWLEQLLAEMEK